jgi:glucose-6-phosphate isomerase
MISKTIDFKNFLLKKITKKNRKNLLNLLKNNSEIINSLKSNYKDNYNFRRIKKDIKNLEIRIIGIGGSILGSEAIHSFFGKKIKKKFHFINNLTSNYFFKKKKYNNLIISKSGNTLETISNFNYLRGKGDKNIFITENKKSYLFSIAQSLKSEIIHHNNFIGGRYSVLSEVGMLPAELMGLNPKKFRQLNNIIKNKNFLNSLLKNVEAILFLRNQKKSNSILLNYNSNLVDFLEWYKQLTAESLGKKGKGILPIISNMPKDNHSLMQFYIDGIKKNFYSFFFLSDQETKTITFKKVSGDYKYLKKGTLSNIIYNQKIATEKTFEMKKIPFRSFNILKKDEKTLGEMFIFFILETILLGKAMNVNPYDQPSVELIKTQTKKYLTR